MSALELPSIEECRAHIRLEIEREQARLHETMERLKAYLHDARSEREDRAIRQRMRETWDNHCRAIEPLRRELDSINRALADIEMLKPSPRFLPDPLPLLIAQRPTG